jgi:hypothetical protein
MSNSVSSLGTIRNTIRNVRDHEFVNVLFEVIDDRVHSKTPDGTSCPSKKVFLDINPRDKKVVVGYSGRASKDDIGKMTRWNVPSKTHNTDSIATCGVGLKLFEYHLGGRATHVSVGEEDSENGYYTSEVSSTAIYDAARRQDISETEFDTMLLSSTYPVAFREELTPKHASFFKDTESIYPFIPQTLFYIERIAHDSLICNLDDEIFVQEKVIEPLIRKYYHLLGENGLELFIRFPKIPSKLDSFKFETSGFLKIQQLPLKDVFERGLHVDVIGLSTQTDTFVVKLYKAVKPLNTTTRDGKEKEVKVGDFIISVGDCYIKAEKNGSSKLRQCLAISESQKSEYLMHHHTFTQYKIPTELGKLYGEKFAGVYLKIGEDFTDSLPVESGFQARNQFPGNSAYRGILEVSTENAKYVKQELGIRGLKTEFNMSSMADLRATIAECVKIYKNLMRIPEGKRGTADPVEYACIKGSNSKSEKGSKTLGCNYIVQLGPKLFKHGKSTAKSINKRIGGYNKKHNDELRIDFPGEEFYDDERDICAVYLPVKCYSNYSSIEQLVSELLPELDDVTTFDAKTGGGIREYFLCDNMDSIDEIINLIRSSKK